MDALHAMTFSAYEVITALAVVAMLILTLSLRTGLSQLRLSFEKDLAGLQVQLANFRADFAREQSSLYRDIMGAMAADFLPRKEAEAMHEANTERLKGLQTDLQQLTSRVGDIG